MLYLIGGRPGHRGYDGAVAQLGERFNGIEEVGGSSPPSSTKLDKIKNLHIEIQVSSLTLALG